MNATAAAPRHAFHKGGTMDISIMVVGFIMGFIVCYFTLGPGSKKKNRKDKD